MADISVLNNLPRATPNGLAPKDLRAALKMMLRIRRFETRAKELFLQGVIKGTAHSSVGQEAIAAGACAVLEPADFILTHHRGHGHTIAKGADLGRMFAELMGRETGYCAGLGGSMHIADFDRGILGANGIVGAGIGLGTGAALAEQLDATGAIGISFFGDGAANEGIFHEAMNLAAIWKLPLIFFCENNQYGLTTPTTAVTAGPSIAARGDAYGVPNEQIDGNDLPAVHMAVSRAALRARAGDGPTLIEALTYRWDDHSMRANLPAYRSEAEEEAWKSQDPIVRLEADMSKLGELDAASYAALNDEAEADVEAAIEWARSQAEPDLAGAMSLVSAPRTGAYPAPPAAGSRKITYAQAITEAFAQQMARDPDLLILGEDVGRTGGIFGLTKGLFDTFGPDRVRDTPISEGAIATCGVGAAMRGKRVVVEAQLWDFVTLMMDAIVNQAAKARFMLGGKAKVPIVFRGPQGAGIRLAAQHCQSLEMLFANVPGLEIYAPSTAYDAKGLMAAALRHDGPVVFLEHKLLYLGQAQAVPEASYVVEPGQARILREGSDCTIVATLAMVERAVQAADKLAGEGIRAEVIDPRTIKPFDIDTIVGSVRKTNRAVVVHEAPRFGGFGGEIAAAITEAAFDWLDAPVARIGAPEMPVPYNDRLERQYMPDARRIAEAVRTVCYRS
ncbi:alpha-ketoacid dehydrogenase subunit alpha/beta [Jannaschia sp. CCS1]|uniref:alpha-ketoacid dehydrogenase subunit alpha/beta n=1 Tax=Jannaschia sp. (strain CCS1) TaxID=290400 RepID=UPI000053BDB4|nr:dehydrogenase E1 component subunit alpha/beta [Jannaschia sp. CCS1]ABD55998.1 dehydrogenase E1 component [Jannaschia sp. CCS1]